jgi:HSP20 family protein
MSLIPWRKKQSIPVTRESTLAPLSEFRTEMDRLFDRYFRGSWLTPSRWADEFDWHTRDFMPSVDVAENDKEITVRAELPGLEADDVDISVSGNTLTIHGEKKESIEDKRDDYYHCERRFGAFTRSIELPVTADVDEIDAELTNGVLTVCVKKLETARTKKVEVKPQLIEST